MSLICGENTFKRILDYLKQSIRFLNEYKSVADAYVSDFFFKCHWDKLPLKWQKFLELLTTEDLTILLDKNKTTTRSITVPPLSLLAFKSCTETYSLNRQCVTQVESLLTQLLTDSSTPPSSNRNEMKTNEGNEDGLHAFFKKHVKPKKRHEIQNLSKVINLLGKKLDYECVIDVGSGLGHLSRLLSFKYGMKVVSVEASSTHAPKASKFDREIEKEVKKKKEKGGTSISDQFNSHTGSLPCHVTRLINPDTTIDEFISVIKENQSINKASQYSFSESIDRLENRPHTNKKMKFTDKSDASDEDKLGMGQETTPVNLNNGGIEKFGNTKSVQPKKYMLENMHHLALNCDNGNVSKSVKTDDGNIEMDKFILTGLHACGDLTSTFLRFFVNCPEAIGLASVGCCYMKLSDESSNSDQETVGYPLSESVKGITNHHLSYAARELACHFADAYCQRLKDNPPHLRIHSYRAALEWLANQICPTFQRSAVQIPAKKTNSLDFDGYVKLGLDKLGMNYSDVTESMMNKAKEMTHCWKDVVSFYTIRLSLAPVVETIVLLDRMLFLFEHGYESAIIPIFDPSLSPRNFVLLAWKR